MGLNGYIIGILGVVSIVSAGAVYVLWNSNQDLREKNIELTLQVQTLNDARKRDARSHDFLRKSLETENERLNQQLLDLSEITDEDGTTYLNSPVPDSVRRLFR